MSKRDKIKIKSRFVFFLICLLSFFHLLFFPNTLWACTDFRVLAKDNTLIVARCVEFSDTLNSNIKTVLRNANFNSTTTGGKPGMSWQTKYGYIAVDAFNAPLTLDGMNEKSLSFEYLFLPGETQYQDVPQGKEAQSIPYHLFGDWILGNFDSVAAVKNALPNIIVFSQQISALGTKVFPLHASVTDALGNSIVIEFVGGKINVYDNQLGVVTNSPSYDWHLVNLRNFMDLSPYSLNPITIDGGLTFIAATQSAGMIGLPGDFASPSRFVRTAIENATAYPADNALQALNIAQHLMNSVDLTKGIVRSKQTGGNELTEWTQWTVFKDITNKIFYYRTYEDMTIRSIALNKVNLSEKGNPLKMALNQPVSIADITDQFISGKGAVPSKKITATPSAPPSAPPSSVTVTPSAPPSSVTVTPVEPSIPPSSITVTEPAPAAPAKSTAIPVIITPPATTTPTPPPPGATTPVPVVVVPGSGS